MAGSLDNSQYILYVNFLQLFDQEISNKHKKVLFYAYNDEILTLTYNVDTGDLFLNDLETKRHILSIEDHFHLPDSWLKRGLKFLFKKYINLNLFSKESGLKNVRLAVMSSSMYTILSEDEKELNDVRLTDRIQRGLF